MQGHLLSVRARYDRLPQSREDRSNPISYPSTYRSASSLRADESEDRFAVHEKSCCRTLSVQVCRGIGRSSRARPTSVDRPGTCTPEPLRVLAPKPDGDPLRGPLLMQLVRENCPHNRPHTRGRHFGAAKHGRKRRCRPLSPGSSRARCCGRSRMQSWMVICRAFRRSSEHCHVGDSAGAFLLVRLR